MQRRVVSLHFKQFQWLYKSVSCFAWSILSRAWLLEFPGLEIHPGFKASYLPKERTVWCFWPCMATCIHRSASRPWSRSQTILPVTNQIPCFQRTIKYRTRPEEINSAVPDLTSHTPKFATAEAVFSTPLNPFNVTPDLKQGAILQKHQKEGYTRPPPLNPTSNRNFNNCLKMKAAGNKRDSVECGNGRGTAKNDK